MGYATISWRGLTLGGDGGGRYRIQSIEGWEDLPPVRSGDESRARAHGDHAGQQLATGRTITAKGVFVDRDDTLGLFLAMQAATPLRDADDPTLDELTITSRGRTLTSFARVVRRSLPQDIDNNNGTNKWALQWTAPDPLRWGAVQSPLSTGLPTSGGGLVYPLVYPLSYGTGGNPGQITLTNPGTAPAPIAFQVVGGLPLGWEVSSAGERLTYPVEVPAGQTLFGDTGYGTLLAEGTADRRNNLINADWIQVPAAATDGTPGTSTLQFTSLGGAYDAAAQLLVPQPRGAYW